jgi:recombination protein RecR
VQLLVEPVARLIDEFSRLPGIGPKTSARIVFHLLRAPAEQTQALAEALLDLRQRTVFCSVCHNITEVDPCAICTDESRDRTLICVVEEPLDVLAIERTGEYRGLYHVLHGVLAPIEGIGPDDLHISDLLPRLKSVPPVREVIIATNPNMEGEATAMYIARQLTSTGVRITRLARGLPVGGDLEYADQITLGRALAGRQTIE